MQYRDMNSIKREMNSSCYPNAGTVRRNTPLDKAGLIVVSEFEIVCDLLYCFQGVNGKYIKYDSLNDRFGLHPSIRVRSKNLILRLTELGWLHLHVKKLADTITKGSVTQHLVDAIKEKVSDYYHDIAGVDIQIKAAEAGTAFAERQIKSLWKGPTLVQLDCWSQRHVRTFRVLYDVLKFIDGKHMGQIVSFLSNSVCNGDPGLSSFMTKLLVETSRPLYKMIVDWMTKGELNDVYDEFFVKLNPRVEEKDIWDSQCVLRHDMIPKIISTEQGMQILRTGHYVHFLHNVCHERPSLTLTQQLLKDHRELANVGLSDLLDPENELSILIEKACIEVSKLALDILKTRFNFEAHLKALRKYMLLREGEVIHCLMKTLEKDLNKTADALDEYTLQAALNSAIESTNTENDGIDVLSLLCVKKMVSSDNEIGWDVFCLVYALDGPLNTVFRLTNGDYSRMFMFLWRIKRAQYVLTTMWEEMTLMYKKASSIMPELRSVFIPASLLVNPMLQFFHRFQSYITFEVIETSWVSFQNEVRRMKTLDAVVKAHSQFMENIQKGCLLHDTDTICSVRSLIDCVLELIPDMEIMCYNWETEYNKRKQYEKDVSKYGTTYEKEEKYQQSVTAFRECLKSSKSKIRLVTKKFKDSMCTLLMKFSENESYSLRDLGHQIDFNEYYQNINKGLSDSFKFCNRSYDFSTPVGSLTNSLSCSDIYLNTPSDTL